MNRFRVSLQTVAGYHAMDFDSRSEAVQRAKRERDAGARDVRVLQEFPWPAGKENRWAANFQQVWP